MTQKIIRLSKGNEVTPVDKETIERVINGLVLPNQADSTASDIAGLRTDLNALLALMKASLLMEAD